MADQAQIAAESSAWQSAHYEEPYYSIRTAKLPRKIAELGIPHLPKDIRILDTCCGRGEALRAMQALGFQNLEGIDATPQRGASDLKLHHGDVRRMPFPDHSFDLITNFHALHHMGGPEGVDRFLSECRRILKPGGKLAIVDFPSSPQIRILFWALRKRLFLFDGGLRNFADIVDEEWSYLNPYLYEWPAVQRVLAGPQFRIIHKRQRFFLYYLVMTPAPAGL